MPPVYHPFAVVPVIATQIENRLVQPPLTIFDVPASCLNQTEPPPPYQCPLAPGPEFDLQLTQQLDRQPV